MSEMSDFPQGDSGKKDIRLKGHKTDIPNVRFVRFAKIVPFCPSLSPNVRFDRV